MLMRQAGLTYRINRQPKMKILHIRLFAEIGHFHPADTTFPHTTSYKLCKNTHDKTLRIKC